MRARHPRLCSGGVEHSTGPDSIASREQKQSRAAGAFHGRTEREESVESCAVYRNQLSLRCGCFRTWEVGSWFSHEGTSVWRRNSWQRIGDPFYPSFVSFMCIGVREGMIPIHADTEAGGHYLHPLNPLTRFSLLFVFLFFIWPPFPANTALFRDFEIAVRGVQT